MALVYDSQKVCLQACTHTNKKNIIVIVKRQRRRTWWRQKTNCNKWLKCSYTCKSHVCLIRELWDFVLAETDRMVIQNVPKAMMLAILGIFSLDQWDSLHKNLNLHPLTVPRTEKQPTRKVYQILYLSWGLNAFGITQEQENVINHMKKDSSWKKYFLLSDNI